MAGHSSAELAGILCGSGFTVIMFMAYGTWNALFSVQTDGEGVPLREFATFCL
jgi:hypothetical protein